MVGAARRPHLAAAAQRDSGGWPDAGAAARERSRRRRQSTSSEPTVPSSSSRSTAVESSSPARSPSRAPIPLTSPTTVMQLLTIAGGVLEYADEKNISIVRTENGKPLSYRFNYKEVKKRQEPGAEHRAQARRHSHRSVAWNMFMVMPRSIAVLVTMWSAARRLFGLSSRARAPVSGTVRQRQHWRCGTGIDSERDRRRRV